APVRPSTHRSPARVAAAGDRRRPAASRPAAGLPRRCAGSASRSLDEPLAAVVHVGRLLQDRRATALPGQDLVEQPGILLGAEHALAVLRNADEEVAA